MGGLIIRWIIFSYERRRWRQKNSALEENFKNLDSSSQILDSLAPSEIEASSSILDCYMFGASRNMVSSAIMICIQSVSQTTPSATRESMKSLQAQDNNIVDQISEACGHYFLDWQMLSNQSVVVILA